MILLLDLALIAAIVWARRYFYDGRGRWIGVKPPDNVVPFRRPGKIVSQGETWKA